MAAVGQWTWKQVDAVGPQPLEAGLQSPDQVEARNTLGVGIRADLHARLGGQNDLVAHVCQRFAENRLAPAFGIDIRGVNEVDAGFDRPAGDADRFIVVAFAAEHHGAQAEARDFEIGVAQQRVLHGWDPLPLLCQPADKRARRWLQLIAAPVLYRYSQIDQCWRPLSVRSVNPGRRPKPPETQAICRSTTPRDSTSELAELARPLRESAGFRTI